MIPVLFLAAIASADPAYDRLFGGAEAATSAAPAGELPAGSFAWPALLAGAGIAAAWQLRKKALAGPTQSGMRVVQRQVVGDKNTLLLVEVDDGAGGQRRLLLGSSQTGLALVQDLGAAAATAREVETFTDALPEVENQAPAARPIAAQVRVQAAAFAEVLDEVLTERGIDRDDVAELDEEAVASDFFRAGTPSRQQFFTEDDLAAETDEVPEPIVQRRPGSCVRLPPRPCRPRAKKSGPPLARCRPRHRSPPFTACGPSSVDVTPPCCPPTPASSVRTGPPGTRHPTRPRLPNTA